MKPIIILPPDAMSPEDIQALRDNSLCVVVSKEPAAVKFVDPIPSISSRTEIENAAIQLSRNVMSPHFWTGGSEATGRLACIRAFFDILVAGTPLDHRGTREEQEQRIIDEGRQEELLKIGREEARAAREAKKAVKK